MVSLGISRAQLGKEDLTVARTGDFKNSPLVKRLKEKWGHGLDCLSETYLSRK